MDSVERHFVEQCIRVMREHYLPKIKEAVTLVSEYEIWESDGNTTNSIGNLLLHLTGNIRQHIISGIGGAADVRVRQDEFRERGHVHKDKLLADLEATVIEACGVLEGMDPKVLHQERMIQNNKTLVFDDLLHVTEHFAYHAGQIIHIVKYRKEHHFQWYAHLEPKF
jgi:hypothetical protein